MGSQHNMNLRLQLVSRPRSSLYISASYRRRWQGGPTKEYREYSEEAQRRQRRREPPRYVTNFWDGTLVSRHGKELTYVVQRSEGPAANRPGRQAGIEMEE